MSMVVGYLLDEELVSRTRSEIPGKQSEVINKSIDLLLCSLEGLSDDEKAYTLMKEVYS